MFNFSIILFLLIASICAKETENTEETALGNTKHPFGDENQFNSNALDNDINQVHCVDKQDLKELEGHCPIKAGTDEISDPYIACPGYDIIPPPHETIYTSNERPAPEVQCKKCDLKLTTDNTAVIVECFQCYDIPSSQREANRIEKNILYKVFHVAVANYTSVYVTGTEYF